MLWDSENELERDFDYCNPTREGGYTKHIESDEYVSQIDWVTWVSSDSDNSRLKMIPSNVNEDEDLIGTHLFESTRTAPDFPTIEDIVIPWTLIITCPSDATLLSPTLVSKQPMSTDFFEYDVSIGSPVRVELPDFVIAQNCTTVTKSYFVLANSQDEVSYISDAENLHKELILETSDQNLQGLTIPYKWLIDLSDGQTGIELAEFEVNYVNAIELPALMMFVLHHNLTQFDMAPYLVSF